MKVGLVLNYFIVVYCIYVNGLEVECFINIVVGNVVYVVGLLLEGGCFNGQVFCINQFFVCGIVVDEYSLVDFFLVYIIQGNSSLEMVVEDLILFQLLIQCIVC